MKVVLTECYLCCQWRRCAGGWMTGSCIDRVECYLCCQWRRCVGGWPAVVLTKCCLCCQWCRCAGGWPAVVLTECYLCCQWRRCAGGWPAVGRCSAAGAVSATRSPEWHVVRRSTPSWHQFWRQCQCRCRPWQSSEFSADTRSSRPSSPQIPRPHARCWSKRRRWRQRRGDWWFFCSFTALTRLMWKVERLWHLLISLFWVFVAICL